MTTKMIADFLWNHWLELLGIVVSYFGIVLPIFQYLTQKKQEERDKRFLNFHKLVKEFVQPDAETKSTMLDRQIAVAYEFRNYPEYYDLLKRMLNDLLKQWGAGRLGSEMELTLKYIDYKKTFLLLRIFQKKP
ncbi:MAG: hypothetical protein WC879_06430 [Melioribacteraceae bacterium]